MQIQYSAKSDPGQVRDHNEDAFLALPDYGFFAVADGMGGHNAGEVASAMALETLGREAEERLPNLARRPGWFKRLVTRPKRVEPRSFLSRAVKKANAEIFAAAQASPEKKGMGTTLVIVMQYGEALLTAHVGDSRVYRLRDSKLTQLTLDHSLASELVRQGVLTPEEALYSTPRNVLTRALGVKAGVEEEVVYHSLEPGDMLLLCSDGLTTMVEDEDLARVIANSKHTLDERVDDLVNLANAAGGEDNITAVLVRFG